MNRGLNWYLASTAFYLVPGGIQQVLFPWLVAVYLLESPVRLGIAQMAGQLPMLFLILWGGLLGDRVDQKRLLIFMHVVMIAPPLLMALVVGMELVVYELLIAWAIVGGILGAFMQPARDAMLNRVAGDDIQRVVTLVIGVQFGIQILGFVLGSAADRVGPFVILLAQAGFMLAAVIATMKLPDTPVVADASSKKNAFKDIAEGLAIAWKSETIRPAIILIFAVGIFFAGTYMVILPLMVRDIYDGGAPGIAGAFAANMLGTCTVIFLLMHFGGLERPGRAMILTGFTSCLILSILHLRLPEWGFYSVLYFWGMCGGISMTMSRAIVQEASPASHRARIMSVYSLGIMGGLPIGSMLLGWSVGLLGARNAVLIPSIGMACVLVYLCIGSNLWQVRRTLVELNKGEEGYGREKT
jgi:MFS family permease